MTAKMKIKNMVNQRLRTPAFKRADFLDGGRGPAPYPALTASAVRRISLKIAFASTALQTETSGQK
jgi:hypothetical protein